MESHPSLREVAWRTSWSWLNSKFLPEAMNFHWNESALKKVRFQKLSRLLRDSVLKVETGGRTQLFHAEEIHPCFQPRPCRSPGLAHKPTASSLGIS